MTAFKRARCVPYDQTYVHKMTNYTLKYSSNYNDCMSSNASNNEELVVFWPESLNFYLDESCRDSGQEAVEWLRSLDHDAAKFATYVRQSSSGVMSKLYGSREQRLAQNMYFVTMAIFDDLHELLSTYPETRKISAAFTPRIVTILSGQELGEAVNVKQLNIEPKMLNDLLSTETLAKSLVAFLRKVLEPKVLQFLFELSKKVWGAWVTELEEIASGTNAISYQQYINIRSRSSVCASMCVVLLKSGDLEGLTISDPFFVAISLGAAIFNDIVSYHKEREELKRTPVNSVAIYMKRETMDEASALKRATGDFNRLVLSLQIMYDNYPEGRQKKTYFKIIQYLGAIAQYHFDTFARYGWVKRKE